MYKGATVTSRFNRPSDKQTDTQLTCHQAKTENIMSHTKNSVKHCLTDMVSSSEEFKCDWQRMRFPFQFIACSASLTR